MAFDLMNLQKNKISRDLGSYMCYWYGNSKTGKSTLCAKLYGDDALFICTEKGYNALNIFAVDLTSWNETTGLLRQLKDQNVKDKFKVIVIDTVDILYDLAISYVLKINGCTDLSDKPFGKLYGEVDKIFNNFLLEITRLGYGLALIGHAKTQSKLAKKGKNEVESDYTIPSLARRGYQIVANMVDNIFYVTIDYDEEGNRIRVLKTRETSEFFAGSRFKYLPETILLDADVLKEEMQKAVDKEENTTDEKKDLFVKENKIDFDKVMEQLNELVMDKFVPNDKLNVVNKIVEKHLGVGNKVADCTEEQADALQIILDELIMKAEELGLK
jgi:hypothetical protein